MFRVIMWASDGSDNADRALEYARELAKEGSARLIAVHVRETMVGRAGGYTVQIDENEVERKIQGQTRGLKDMGIDATYEQQGAVAGGVAHALAELANELGADVIVAGTRGQGPITGVLLGSVTQRLLHVAHCPVLVVPSPKTSSA